MSRDRAKHVNDIRTRFTNSSRPSVTQPSSQPQNNIPTGPARSNQNLASSDPKYPSLPVMPHSSVPAISYSSTHVIAHSSVTAIAHSSLPAISHHPYAHPNQTTASPPILHGTLGPQELVSPPPPTQLHTNLQKPVSPPHAIMATSWNAKSGQCLNSAGLENIRRPITWSDGTRLAGGESEQLYN
jgi:hypothetical protein